MERPLKNTFFSLTLTQGLAILNTALVLILLLLNNAAGFLPLGKGDFIFFALLTLGLSLYRPGWAFLFLVGTMPLEIIDLAPGTFPFNIRPYQLIAGCLISALGIRFLGGRLNFKWRKFDRADHFTAAIILGSLVSAVFSAAPGASLKMSLVLFSFFAIYLLVRQYVQNLADLKKVIPFFLSSGIVTAAYGLWQNYSFTRGLAHFETMPGRPNGPYLEADWFGMYLVLLISAGYSLFFSGRKNAGGKQQLFIFKFLVQFFVMVSFFIVLIMTVSRSAWLGAFAATFIFLFSVLTGLRFNFFNWAWRKAIVKKFVILAAAGVAILSVYVFKLSTFQLAGRATSTGSGLQEITVSCENPVTLAHSKPALPAQIKDVRELEGYGCRHIDLEQIGYEKSLGRLVTTVKRPDPNINIRAEIYDKTWQLIKDDPVFGIGWGMIGQSLGKDARGFYYNSSNIFLETWLGAGLLGLAAAVTLLIYILSGAIRTFIQGGSLESRRWSLFVIASWFGIIVANLFNAGLFLGFFWLWLAVGLIRPEGIPDGHK